MAHFEDFFSVAAANHAQRRADAEEDENIDNIVPETSLIAKRRAAKRQAAGDNSTAPLSKINEHD